MGTDLPEGDQLKYPEFLKAKNILINYNHTYSFCIFVRVNYFIMNTKLTLNLNKSVIEEAKSYAKKHKVSLSGLIENYLSSLSGKTENNAVSPLVESLTGVMEPIDEDYKKDYIDYLSKKHS